MNRVENIIYNEGVGDQNDKQGIVKEARDTEI